MSSDENLPQLDPPGRSPWLDRFAASLVRHRIRWTAVALVGVAGAGWAGLGLTPRFDLNDYLPRTATPRTGADFPFLGGADRIVVVLDSRGTIPAGEARPILEGLAGRLAVIPGVRRVDYRVPRGLQEFLDREIPRHLLGYFTPGELDSLGSRLSRDYLERALLGRGPPIPRTALARALGIERSDPLEVVGPVVDRLRELRGLTQIRVVDGYFAVPDQRAFFLTVEPERGPGTVNATRTLARAVNRVMEETRTDPALAPVLAGKRLLALGRPVAVLQGFDVALSDLRRVLIGSAFLVLGLLVLFLRRIAAPLFILGTVGYGIVLTAGVAALVSGSVSVVSWVFITALIGFGDEFALYVVSHYWLTPRGTGRAAALAAALRRPGPGILLGGLTSAAAFFSLVVLSYPVMVELAWLTTIGLLIVLACAFTVLPLGLSYTEPGRASGSPPRWLGWLARLGRIGFERPARVAVLWAALVVASAWLATGIRFELHPWKLAARGIPVTAQFEEVSARLGASFTPFLMVSEGSTVEEALALDRSAVRAFQSIKERAGIAAIVSPGNWLPAPEEQRASAEFVARNPERFSPSRFRRDFLAVMARRSPDSLLTARYLPLVSRYLRPPEPVSIERLRAAGLGEFLDRHLIQSGGRHFAVSELYPYRIPWSGGVVERFTEAVSAAGGSLAQVRFVGDALRGATHAGVLRRDLFRATAIAPSAPARSPRAPSTICTSARRASPRSAAR